jgi:drug/metabolite transporter (DMT)-like permease
MEPRDKSDQAPIRSSADHLGPREASPASQLASWLTGSWVWQHAGDGARLARGHTGALLSPLFLGLAPFFAKLAYNQGAATYTVIAMRMIRAAGALWLIYLVFAREYIRSWWLGISVSALAGIVNGLGSICYYQGLARIDASLASILNVSYLVFLTVLLRILGQTISRLTLVRLALAFAAVYLLSLTRAAPADPLGVALLLIGAFAYAVQLVIGQRVLYDIPAPTMTLYSVSAMALVVTVAWFYSGGPEFASLNERGWHALLAFAGVTALSRLTLFLGVERLGSVHAATLGVSEVLVTVGFSMLFLGETLVAQQWIGGALMTLSVALLAAEKDIPSLIPIPLLPWMIRLSVRLQRRRQK